MPKANYGIDAPTVLHWETADARWVRREELVELELFAAFAETLELLGLT